MDGIDSYTCKCKENYMGDNCETSELETRLHDVVLYLKIGH